MKTIAGWWFGTFFIFPYIGNNHPNWLIFFRGVQTCSNHQPDCITVSCLELNSHKFCWFPSGFPHGNTQSRGKSWTWSALGFVSNWRSGANMGQHGATWEPQNPTMGQNWAVLPMDCTEVFGPYMVLNDLKWRFPKSWGYPMCHPYLCFGLSILQTMETPHTIAIFGSLNSDS